MKTLTFLTLTLVLAVVMALTPATAQQEARPLADQVWIKYRVTLEREDIQELLPDVLEGMKDPAVQPLLNPQNLTLVVANPDLLTVFVPGVDARFVTLLKTDAALRAMLGDPLVHALLQDPDEIDVLVEFLAEEDGTREVADIHFPDANLAREIRGALDLPANAVITTEDLRRLTKLDASGAEITNLTGLEYASNLARLDLGGFFAWWTEIFHVNRIANISPLANLTELTYLDLGNTEVSDVSALANLTQLENLGLGITDVEDVSALANLTNLVGLRLNGTAVSDVSALANLTQLEVLDLGRTDVSDISALANLTQLEWLDLSDTDVSDISLLVGELQHLVELDLNGCPLSHASIHTHIPALEAKGVEVYFYAPDDDGEILAPEEEEDIHFPDANLAREIRGALDLPADAEITLADLRGLTELEALDAGIADLTGLEHATNLTRLYLGPALSFFGEIVGVNAIEDISALANLTQLEYLNLEDTDVSDISALANLTQLEYLNLEDTDVSDISALANLTQLTELELDNTDVSDISALVNLTMDALGLRGCPLSHASIHTHIPALEAKWVDVFFDNVAHPALLKVSGDWQEGAPNTALPDPFVVAATDENGRPLVDLPVVFKIGGGSGTQRTDAKGHAAVTLMLADEQPGVLKLTASAEGIRSWVLFNVIVTGTESAALAVDVNGDGRVDWRDLVEVARNYYDGVRDDIPNLRTDVNGDGEFADILDLIAVAEAIDARVAAEEAAEGDAEGAPALARGGIETGSLQVADVQQWLRDAKAANVDPGGIAVLERLLAALMRVEAPPKETALLANYPNPFNPETWIPYQLAAAAEVTVSIYALDGKLVRRLELGQVSAGTYQNRSRAAYWDGRNAVGEPVASGVYFYTLTAGDFFATRKMVIRK